MTVLSFSSLLARPRRRAVPPRHLRSVSRPVPRRPWRRTYHDPFFADPAVVEDDSRRMRRGASAP
jgi:hypothetical protein